jgi:hypothetical protein
MAGQPFRPENAVFGMLIDGKRSSFRLTSLKEAEAMTVNLVAQGRRIEIFDYVTKKIVKTLS